MDTIVIDGTKIKRYNQDGNFIDKIDGLDETIGNLSLHEMSVALGLYSVISEYDEDVLVQQL